MPGNDLQEAKRVWEYTKQLIINGNIVSFIQNERRNTNFPSKKFSAVSHVRPHASNAEDTTITVTDKVTGLDSYTKHCFWLNSRYIKEAIYLE